MVILRSLTSLDLLLAQLQVPQLHPMRSYDLKVLNEAFGYLVMVFVVSETAVSCMW